MPAYIIEIRRKLDHKQRGVGNATTTKVEPFTRHSDYVATWSFNTTETEANMIAVTQTNVIDGLPGLSYAG